MQTSALSAIDWVSPEPSADTPMTTVSVIKSQALLAARLYPAAWAIGVILTAIVGVSIGTAPVRAPGQRITVPYPPSFYVEPKQLPPEAAAPTEHPTLASGG